MATRPPQPQRPDNPAKGSSSTFDHRSLLSGQTTGLLASSTRLGLRSASLLYGVGARVRRFRYDSGRATVNHVDVPVISVGNLTTGGTGKTPVVCDLCSRLRQLGHRVAIISRGYGAGDSGINDEALEMAERLPDVPHVQHADRVEAARIAVEELEAEVLVMDDGFQHRRLHRDLDLVVVDATCPFGFGYMLPRGYLREPVSSLGRADAAILTRTDQVDTQALASLRTELRTYLGDRPLIETSHAPSKVQLDRGVSEPIESLQDRSIALISAIGNPDAFEKTVSNCGGQIAGHYRLADHDPYDRETRQALRMWIESLQSTGRIDRILCTHKDAVKIAADQIAGVPLGYLQIDLQIRTGEEQLQTLVESCGVT
ncbi:tetraacyldisaccharide 4'-kinase [Allorhodopirellula heiligendammensis]|uniref:Tetraacyldisaccharide 4'-kinase n=1 Tax=Allorhodopirellula heiligendammensis TaxID=2714739 RepID=A0A5C6C351_9BACT|nr:tetraacyldisaccharide 4'-kinase [Allorhodopirellula heiligendammensis]TWU18041.1 Tetraacyldisaccharide 4'-kinase [Allorhodopirellula heiligendammensis]